MHAGLGFRDCSVVDLHLNRLALDEDALDGLAVGGNQNPLRGCVIRRAHRDWNLSRSVAVVDYVDSYQPVAALHGVGEDTLNTQVGQALVRIDPIGEEPGEIAAGSGLQPQDEDLSLGPACSRSFSNWLRPVSLPKSWAGS